MFINAFSMLYLWSIYGVSMEYIRVNLVLAMSFIIFCDNHSIFLILQGDLYLSKGLSS